MTQPLRRLDELPDDPPPAKKKRRVDSGVLSLLEKVAEGMKAIEALSARVASLEKRPPPPPPIIHNHFTVPKDSIKVDAPVLPAMPAMPEHTVVVKPADVVVQPHTREKVRLVHHRNAQGRIEYTDVEQVE